MQTQEVENTAPVQLPWVDSACPPDVFPPRLASPPHLPAGAAATAESLTLVSESVSECRGVSRVGKSEAEAGEQEGSSEARPGSG